MVVTGAAIPLLLLLLFLGRAIEAFLIRAPTKNGKFRLDLSPKGSDYFIQGDSKFERNQETLLRVHLTPLRKDALDNIKNLIRSLQFAVTLPSTPLFYLPTSDGGVVVSFFQSASNNQVEHTKAQAIPRKSGGIVFSIEKEENAKIVMTLRRTGNDQSNVAEEKTIVKHVLDCLKQETRNGDMGFDHLEVFLIDSIYHKWMLEVDSDTILDAL